MAAPVRSYSYGPDFSNVDDMPGKKRKRSYEGDDSLSSHLTSLSGDQTVFSSLPAARTPALSDVSSVGDESPGMLADKPFVFSSPAPTIFLTPRKLANPYKRAHFNRASLTNIGSSPIIPPTPALTFTSDSLPQLSQMHASTQACHICQHRPANVQDLSSYTDCEACHQRTCSVCTRICEGPRCRSFISGRQTLFSGATPRTAPDGEVSRGKSVCRNCCIEVGVDGHVWCTACYADDTELENFGMTKNKKSMEHESLGRIASWLQECGPDDMVIEEPEISMDLSESWT